MGEDFIEAHHTQPLGELDDDAVAETEVADLRPVCSNCHRMLHRFENRTIEDLQSVLAQMGVLR